MPKAKKYVRVGNENVQVAVPSKNKIGGRKSIRTAHQMSTAELLEVRAHADYSRDRNIIDRVLMCRGAI